MTPPLRELRALINIIEAESDMEERGLLIEAARTVVRRLRSKKRGGSQADGPMAAADAIALLESMLSSQQLSRQGTDRTATKPAYA